MTTAFFGGEEALEAGTTVFHPVTAAMKSSMTVTDEVRREGLVVTTLVL